MSEHHRGAWGSREEAVWWPGGIAQDQQNMHHQHLINQQHQQQQQQQLVQQHQVQQIQQHQVVQQQAHNDVQRSNSSAAPGQQLFTYKMASSFQNPAGGAVAVATTNAAYDYRLPAATNAAAPGTQQWWYTTQQNVEQVHQNQAHQQTNQQHQQTTNQHQAVSLPKHKKKKLKKIVFFGATASPKGWVLNQARQFFSTILVNLYEKCVFFLSTEMSIEQKIMMTMMKTMVI